MAIKFNSVKCPECGATLEVEKERTNFFCSYCGTKIIATDENRKEYHHYDEAKIRKAEIDMLVRLKELELEEKKMKSKKKKTGALIFLTLLSAILCVLFWFAGAYIGTLAFFVIMLLSINAVTETKTKDSEN